MLSKLKTINKIDSPKLWQQLSGMRLAMPHWLATVLIGLGLILILLGVMIYIKSSSGEAEYKDMTESAHVIHQDSEKIVQGLQSILRAPATREIGREFINKKIDYRGLVAALKAADDSIIDARAFGSDVLNIDIDTIGNAIYPQHFVLYDMLLEANEVGMSSIQVMQDDGRDLVVGVTKLKDKNGDIGFLLVSWKSDELLDNVATSNNSNGFLSLQQYVGSTQFNTLASVGVAPESWSGAERLPVKGSLFHISWSQPPIPGVTSRSNGLLVMLLGLLVMTIGWLRKADGATKSDEPTMAADQSQLAVSTLGQEETNRQAEEMAAFNTQQLSIESPAPGAEEEDDLFTMKTEKINELPPIPVTAELQEPVKPEARIFKAYDIRGVVNKTLTEDGACFIGKAVGTLAVRQDAGPVVVARDGRFSGPALIKALKKGLLSTGCDVIEIGMVPTGVLYYAAAELGSGSGVMVTGSHNPPEYNGLKMVIGGHTLASEDIQGLYRMILEDDFETGVGVTRIEGVLSDYQKRISSDIKLTRPLKIVADCGNGVGGVNAVPVLQSIGADVSALYDDVDGSFPNHHPDPSVPENLKDLIEAVQHTGADLGVAFDGDADRLGVIIPSGEIIYSDRLMILFVQDILSRNPGATIIYDVKCSRHLTTAIREAGGVPLMWKTGHSLIKNKMREMKSPFAGEMSGHFFFKERWFGVDDGIYSACRLLEILAGKDQSPEEVLAALPHGVSTPELKVEMAEGENHAFIAVLQDRAHFDHAEINTIDGLRVDFDDGWGLVRASNTTPILVMRFDADTEAALQRIKNAFRDLLMSLRPDLDLPF